MSRDAEQQIAELAVVDPEHAAHLWLTLDATRAGAWHWLAATQDEAELCRRIDRQHRRTLDAVGRAETEHSRSQEKGAPPCR